MLIEVEASKCEISIGLDRMQWISLLGMGGVKVLELETGTV